jgi:hypothetical protein
MALLRTSSKSPQSIYNISLKRDDMLENPIFDEGMETGKIKLLESSESKIIQERFNEEIMFIMNEKDHLVSLKQRKDNECGYYSLISVFFSLIKKEYGELDINFRNLLIEKATSLGITTDYKGISGDKLVNIINAYFFDYRKVCSYQTGDPLEPRINGMIVKGHWIGQIPFDPENPGIGKRGNSFLLEPFSGKIFEVDDKYLEKVEDDILMQSREIKGNFRNHDHKIFIKKNLLFKLYQLFTKSIHLKPKPSSIELSVIEEGDESLNESSESIGGGRKNRRKSLRKSRGGRKTRRKSLRKSRGGRKTRRKSRRRRR